jgi:Fic family protein
MEATNMSANEWANVISRLHVKNCDKVEKGFFTRSDWEKKWGLGTSETNKKIKRLLNAGMMETKKFRIPLRQNTYPTPHYRIVK